MQFCPACSRPYHPVFHEHVDIENTTLVTLADFMTVNHPSVAPRERKARENGFVPGGLTVGRERHVTRGGKGVVGRL